MAISLCAFGSAQETKKRETGPIEPARFWTGIANDEKQEAWRRGIAIHRLLERHLDRHATLGNVAEVLARPEWAKPENVLVVERIIGYFPLSFTEGDTLFSIHLFKEVDERGVKEQLLIALNVTGKISKEQLLDAIHGKKNGFEDIKLKAWAIRPDLDSYIKLNSR